MAVAETPAPTGGAPRPDPARVAAIRYTIVDEAETCATFAEGPRAALVSLNERTLAETRSGHLGECGLLLDHVRDRIAGLDVTRLNPRRGLAGLFDSRGGRLKAFRAAYASAASAVIQSSADMGDRAGALARRGAALETLWTETRDAISELDAHIAAARGWLSAELPAPTTAPVEAVETPIEAQADAEAFAWSLPDPAAESADVVALPHPLTTRLSALEAVRATAIGRLPLLRAAQNADCRAPAALKAVCEGTEAWRAEWLDALGLAGKKPRKVRPDPVRLENASAALADRIATAGRELSDAQARRSELEGRKARPLRPQAEAA